MASLSVSTTHFQNIRTSMDGARGYTTESWEAYPERSADLWGKGFSDTFELQSGVYGAKDDLMSVDEAMFALQQLVWDRDADGNGYDTDLSVNANPISEDDANSGVKVLSSLLANRKDGKFETAIDANGDGLSQAEIDALAAKDGDASSLSLDDLEIARGFKEAPEVSDTDATDEATETAVTEDSTDTSTDTATDTASEQPLRNEALLLVVQLLTAMMTMFINCLSNNR